MKKLISVVLALAIILSMMTGIISYAAILQETDVTAVFWDNFDDYSKWENASNPYKELSQEAEGQTDFAGCEIISYNGENVLWVKDNDVNSRVSVTSQAVAVEPNTIYTIMVDSYAETGIFNVSYTLYTSLEYADNNHTVKSTDYPENTEYGRSIYADFEKVNETLVCHVMTSSNAKAMKASVMSSLATPTEGYVDNMRIYKGYVEYQRPADIDPPVQVDAVDGQLIKPNGDKLIYNTYNEQGDTLTDFSYAGYYKGEYELPDSSKLTTYATVEAPSDSSADHTSYLQTYMDGAGDAYSQTGKLQVVKLKAGRYNINKNGVRLRNGVILSGEGQGPDGTVLYNKDKIIYGTESSNTLIIAGTAPQMVGNTANITDRYVKAGSSEFAIEADKISNFKVGDLITIMHPNEDKWNKAMGMTNITSSSGTNSSWDPGEVNMATERTIVAINENKITVDYPLYVPYDNTVAQSYIYVTSDIGRMHDVGIENLRLESYFNGIPTDENHANNAISFTNAKNCYVRDVSAKYFLASAVSISNGSKQITVKNCSSLKPISTEAGSRRYAFAISNAQQILVTGCYSYDGRHDYVVSNPATGPIVFSDNVSDLSQSNTEPHGIWSTGILYDNIFSVSNYAATGINVSNGGKSGTTVTHGWLGSGVVMYNCLAAAISAIKPPLTYQNFLIGTWGIYDDDAAAKRKQKAINSLVNSYHTSNDNEAPSSISQTVDGTPFVGDAYKESQFAPVEPRSLYKAQLSERLTGSFKNAKPNAPILMAPRGEEEYAQKSNSVEFSGVYQKGATRVIIYVDNMAYDAVLNKTDYTFKTTLSLSDGTHKVYVTQVIDGVESTKSADRFIVVKQRSANTNALQSTYNYNKINPINSYKIASYDVIDSGIETGILADIGEKYYGDSSFSIAVNNSSNQYANIKYLSSNENVATVSSDGTVTIKDAGTTNLSVIYTLNGQTAVLRDQKTLNVKKKDITVASIDTANQTVALSGVLAADLGKVSVDYSKIVFTVPNTRALTSVVANNFELVGESAYRYNVTSVNVAATMNSDEILISGQGTEASPFIIDSAYKFTLVFAKGVDSSKRTGNYHFLQTQDIVIDNFVPETEIAFNGTYKCGSISGGVITPEVKTIEITIGDENTIASENTSLFGKLDSATISDLTVSGNVYGGKTAGSFAGTIVNSTLTNCDSSANVYGANNSGGIVGMATGSTISGCDNYADVTGINYVGGILGKTTQTNIENCSAEGTVTGTNYVGGISGDLITSSTIKSTSFSGALCGEDYVGGIAGEISASTVEEATFTGSVDGKYYVGGILGVAKDDSNVKSSLSSGEYINGKYYLGGVCGSIEAASKVILTTNNTSVTGIEYLGGIAGINKGIIGNCENNGTMSDSKYIGGIAGKSEGRIENSTNNASVEATEYVGGIAGISEAYAVITNCENKGSIGGSDYIGGITGYAKDTVSVTGCTNSHVVNGESYVGGIAGLLTGSATIEESENNAAVTAVNYTGGIAGEASGNSKISTSDNRGNIISTAYAGGIAARASEKSTVERCMNYADVTGADAVGGIVAIIDNIICECGNEGTVTATSGNAGGIAGTVIKPGTINISESYNEGEIKADSTVGGILAFVEGVEGVSVAINDCYNNGVVDGRVIGSVVGNFKNAIDTKDSNGNITKLNTSDLTIISFYDTKNIHADIIGICGTDVIVKADSAYVLNGAMADKYKTPGTSPSNPIKISTADEFKSYFGKDGSNKGKMGDNLYFKQTASFNLGTYTPNSEDIFTGTYNGGGYTITYTITSPTSDNQGLFGRAKSATFKNIVTEGTITIGDTNVFYIGGIVGLIDECTFESCVNGVDMNASSNGNYFGGIAGSYTGTKPSYFKNCINNGNFTKIRFGRTGGIVANAYANFEGCTNNGTLNINLAEAGGIAGRIESPVNDVTTSTLTIKNCANKGTIESSLGTYDYFGGIVGMVETNNTNVNITQCFNTGAVTTETSSSNISNGGGIIGRVTSKNSTITINDCFNTGKITVDLGVEGSFVGANVSETATVIVKDGYDSSKSDVSVIGSTMANDSYSNIFVLPNSNGDSTNPSKLKNLVANGTLSSSVWTTKSDENSGYPQLIDNPYTTSAVPTAPDEEFELIVYAKAITEADLIALVSIGEFSSDIWGFDTEGSYNYPILLWDGLVNPKVMHKEFYYGTEALLQGGYISDNYVVLSAQFMLNSYADEYEYGYLVSRQNDENFVYENESVKKLKANSNKDGIFGIVLMFGKTVTEGENCYIRPYIRYFDAEGNSKCAYGEIKSFVTQNN